MKSERKKCAQRWMLNNDKYGNQVNSAERMEERCVRAPVVHFQSLLHSYMQLLRDVHNICVKARHCVVKGFPAMPR
jgi:class 3 adenylate cyclase